MTDLIARLRDLRALMTKATSGDFNRPEGADRREIADENGHFIASFRRAAESAFYMKARALMPELLAHIAAEPTRIRAAVEAERERAAGKADDVATHRANLRCYSRVATAKGIAAAIRRGE